MNVINKSIITLSLVAGLAVASYGLNGAETDVKVTSSSMPTKEVLKGYAEEITSAKKDLNAFMESQDGKDAMKDADVKNFLVDTQNDLNAAGVLVEKFQAGQATQEDLVKKDALIQKLDAAQKIFEQAEQAGSNTPSS